jgi:hypothetical protein
MQLVNDRIELNNEIMMGKPLEKIGLLLYASMAPITG